MKIVAISDTHSQHRGLDVPDGDILLHAGDLTLNGTESEVEEFNEYLASLPHRHKVIIAGNHDFCLQTNSLQRSKNLLSNATYLQDESAVVEGVKIYGSPWQPAHLNMAFNMADSSQLAECWMQIPTDTKILLTHTPPFGIGDRLPDKNIGCTDLLQKVIEIRPLFHVFGHVHEGRGTYAKHSINFINASTANEGEVLSEPIVFEI